MIPGDKAFYPGTDILKNKFDIRDAKTAHAVEYKFTSARSLQLAQKPIKGNFDFEHLQAIHKHIFQDVYDWAGKTREIDFAKRNKETGLISRFAPVSSIEKKAADFGRFIADKQRLEGLTKPEFIKAITEVHTKLNELHPFREGNGRATRIFLAELAKHAGYELDLEKIDKGRWHDASSRALGQYDPKTKLLANVPNQMEMRQIFHEACKPTLAHAFDFEPREAAMKHHPQLRVVYNRIDALKQLASKHPDKQSAEKIIDAETKRISQKLHQGLPLVVAIQRDHGKEQGRSPGR